MYEVTHLCGCVPISICPPTRALWWDSLWAESVRFDLARWPGSNAASEGSPRRRRRRAASDPRVPQRGRNALVVFVAYSKQPWVPSGQIVVARQIIMCCGGQFLRVKGGTSVRARTHVGCLRWCLCWCAWASVVVCEGICVIVRGRRMLGVFVGVVVGVRVVTCPGLSALSPLLSAPSPQLC